MKQRIMYMALLPLLIFNSSVARADDLFVYGKVGTGVEAGVGKVLNDNFSVRLGIGRGFSGSNDRNIGGNHYDIKPDSSTSLNAMVDWFPVAGSGFRMSGGLVYSNKQAQNLTAASDSGGNYHLNGNTYSASEVGQLRGKSTFSKFSPYLGVGWESAAASKPGWRFISDVGAQFMNGGKASLSASSGAGNAALGQDLAAEQRRVSSDFHDRKFQLGISIGTAYSF
ncbi:hypothetical protein [Collimonas sp.]|jgi:hypothetical protein|uniref:hypothetical protein n=1 Tax=Collimonas sp. TaxID=1963772 RepID=UPI002BA2549B|nr:hypothetical protein [Collimonas sp.]HWW05948.1 hypothetical protein [Collimonas sp.]